MYQKSPHLGGTYFRYHHLDDARERRLRSEPGQTPTLRTDTYGAAMYSALPDLPWSAHITPPTPSEAPPHPPPEMPPPDEPAHDPVHDPEPQTPPIELPPGEVPPEIPPQH